MTNLLSVCKKCGLPIHTEVVWKSGTRKSGGTEWLHDDYVTAWKVVNGMAQNLHFAVPGGEEE